MPWTLAKEYGGFRNREAIDMFVKFAKACLLNTSMELNTG